MLPDHYFIAGLDALSGIYPPGSHHQAGFGMAHYSAALISGSYLIQDALIEPEAIPVMRSLLDKTWMGWDAMAPQPDEAPSPELLERYLAALQASFGTSDYAGHHVIFASLALRVLRQLPRTITHRRITGLLNMTEVFPPVQPRMAPSSDVSPHHPGAFCNEVLTAFLAETETANGPRGHLLTFGCAVLDLHALGYTHLARTAELGFRDFMSQSQGQPKASPELKQVSGQALNPESAAFWRSRPEDYLMQFIGHYIKYPYAFLTLEAKATDAGIKAEARRRLHWVLDPRSPR
jgi:hypothetical protein